MAAKRRRGKSPLDESRSLGGTLDAEAREVLIAARHAAHVTQKELAERLERPQSYVGNIERGAHALHRSDFIACARALGADPSVLFARVFEGARKPRRRSVRRKAG
jgi:transcriptional regulator with XRE-family HTH domain